MNYGRAVNSLNVSVTATLRGDNFAIPSQPFMFSAVLTGLGPGVTYYYQVEARNSEGPTLSAVQQFTSAELRMYNNRASLCMSVYQKLLGPLCACLCTKNYSGIQRQENIMIRAVEKSRCME